MCNGNCTECYDIDNTDVLHSAPLEIGYSKTSDACQHPPYNLIDFEHFQIETQFGSRGRLIGSSLGLDSSRVPFDSRNIYKTGEPYQFAIDSLPRLCFSANSSHLRVHLNDANKHSKVTWFDESKYVLDVFAVLATTSSEYIQNLATSKQAYQPVFKHVLTSGRNQSESNVPFAIPLEKLFVTKMDYIKKRFLFVVIFFYEF